jgi:hypothetical protein
MAQVVVAFTVDVAEASWPDERYAVGVAVGRERLRRVRVGHSVWVVSPARRLGLASPVTTDTVWVLRRWAVRRDRRHRHVAVVLPANPSGQARNEPD